PGRPPPDDAIELRLPSAAAHVRLLPDLRVSRSGGGGAPGAAVVDRAQRIRGNGSTDVTIAVVLPAYNEAGNITPLVTARARAGEAAALSRRIIVVDDGSAGGTRAEAEGLRSTVAALRVVAHPSNLGLARAVKTGIVEACREGCDAAVFMDGDLSHDPSE